MALILVWNGAGRTPVYEIAENLESALRIYRDTPGAILIDGNVIEVKEETKLVAEGLSIPAVGAAEEAGNDPGDAFRWSPAAGAPRPAERAGDVAVSGEGQPGSAPSGGPGEGPQPGGDRPSSGAGAG